MTREEAIALLNEQYETCKRIYDCSADQRKSYPNVPQFMEALGMALTALSGMQRVLEDIDAAPTIDPESLRPRGMWEGTADGYADGELVYDTWTCSECGYTVDTDDPDDLTKFCPNCGAKMEGGHNP